jgi:hypothetical protein
MARFMLGRTDFNAKAVVIKIKILSPRGVLKKINAHLILKQLQNICALPRSLRDAVRAIPEFPDGVCLQSNFSVRAGFSLRA